MFGECNITSKNEFGWGGWSVNLAMSKEEKDIVTNTSLNFDVVASRISFHTGRYYTQS